MLKVLAHPLRQRILLHYHERVSSPRAVSEALDERIGNVAYHTRRLLDAECIELVRTEPKRGAVEHFYRATVRPWLTDEQWARLPVPMRRSIFGDILDRIRADVVEAGRDGGFDEVETHVSRSLLTLDDRGWEELTALLAETLDRALEIHSASLGRLVDEGDGREPRETELAMLHFVRPANSD